MSPDSSTAGSADDDFKLSSTASYSSFFLPPQAFSTQSGRAVTDDAAICHQLRKVLRLKIGDGIRLLDGVGHAWLATIVSLERNSTVFKLETLCDQGESTAKERCRIVCLLPLIKGHRFEWALEKLTEIGVHQIMPFATTRTIVKIKDDNQGRLKRWQLITKEAAEQSERLTLPTIDEPAPLAEVLHNLAAPAGSSNDSNNTYRLLLSERSKAPNMVQLLARGKSSTDNSDTAAGGPSTLCQIALIVGPEGGFTEEECGLIRENNFLPVSMGDTILRSETAAILAAGMAIAIASTLD